MTVKVGANGKVNLYNSKGSTNVIADVVGLLHRRRRHPAAAGSPP